MINNSSFTRNCIETGPNGRAVAELVSEDVLSALQLHLNMERQAEAAYFAVAIWFAERELRGFAHYFRDESLGEHDHATQFVDYIIARGQAVELHSIDSPNQSWENSLQVMETSFQMEADLTSSLHQIYSLAERASDIRTTIFLDPMIEKQIQAENQFAYLLGRVRFASNDPSALLQIDNELFKGLNQPANLKRI